jgi:hypothetical protein
MLHMWIISKRIDTMVPVVHQYHTLTELKLLSESPQVIEYITGLTDMKGSVVIPVRLAAVGTGYRPLSPVRRRSDFCGEA